MLANTKEEEENYNGECPCSKQIRIIPVSESTCSNTEMK